MCFNPSIPGDEKSFYAYEDILGGFSLSGCSGCGGCGGGGGTNCPNVIG